MDRELLLTIARAHVETSNRIQGLADRTYHGGHLETSRLYDCMRVRDREMAKMLMRFYNESAEEGGESAGTAAGAAGQGDIAGDSLRRVLDMPAVPPDPGLERPGGDGVPGRIGGPDDLLDDAAELIAGYMVDLDPSWLNPMKIWLERYRIRQRVIRPLEIGDRVEILTYYRDSHDRETKQEWLVYEVAEVEWPVKFCVSLAEGNKLWVPVDLDNWRRANGTA